MLRLAMITAAALASGLFAHSSRAHTPYLSALSTRTGGVAVDAPPNCAKTFCQADECNPTTKATHCGPGPGGYGCRTTHC